MPAAKIYITNNQNKVKIPTGARLLIKRCCNAVLTYEAIKQLAEISISFTDDTGIRDLNTAYRNKPTATDVLSFPLSEGDTFEINEDTQAIMLGDVVISMERAMEQANLYGHSLERELGFLTVHSMFHLLGYDHELGGLEERIMREKEEAVLMNLGLSREVSFVERENK